MNRTVCIYHLADLDGQMSAAIVKLWFNQQEVPNKKGESINTIDFIGYNYGNPIPDLSEYDKVIMCDISFHKETMNALALYGKLIWVDHHISAIKDSEIDNGIIAPYNNISGLRDTKFAACELTWMYFFPNEPMPEIVRLLGRYDCFGHKGTEEETKVLEFQYGARQRISNYEEAYNYLKIELNSYLPNANNYDREENPIYRIWNNGKSIYQYLCTEAKQSYKNGFEIKFDNPKWDTIEHHPELQLKLKFICINKERFNPINFGIDYHRDGYDGCACFWHNGNKWNFSLYNGNGKVDCSQIAKQFGGGGHNGAAGFQLSSEQFNSLI